MKLRYFPLLTLLFLLPLAVKADDIEKIADLLKQGNVHELAKLFATNVDMNILDEANVYSKAQSEMILDKFFKENKPHAVKLLHRVSSNPNYNFGVVILTTDRGKFRISYTLREINKVMTLIELRIETEKT
jgi:vacuolar-type H+-ATPase subunit E/Vma4